MLPAFSVFRGPGNRLVAISTVPMEGRWIIRSGEEGKRLRATEVPVDKYSDMQAITAAHISSDYELLFTGVIDTYGRCTDNSAALIYWEATAIDVVPLKERLREYAKELKETDLDFTFVDDLTGCTVQSGRSKFGVTRAITPGCVNADGHGSDALSVTEAADLLSLVACLADSVSIRFADAEGKALSRGQVLNRCGSNVSSEMVGFLKAHGFVPLATTLRSLNQKQVRF